MELVRTFLTFSKRIGLNHCKFILLFVEEKWQNYELTLNKPVRFIGEIHSNHVPNFRMGLRHQESRVFPHMKCQRHILGIRWHDRIRKTEITERTALPPLIAQIIKRHNNSLFIHVVICERYPGTSSSSAPDRHLSWTASRSYLEVGSVLLVTQKPSGWIRFALIATFQRLIFGDVPSVEVIPGWRNCPSWLRDDDDDDMAHLIARPQSPCYVIYRIGLMPNNIMTLSAICVNVVVRKLLSIIIFASNSQKSTQDQLESVIRKGPHSLNHRLVFK